MLGVFASSGSVACGSRVGTVSDAGLADATLSDAGVEAAPGETADAGGHDAAIADGTGANGPPPGDANAANSPFPYGDRNIKVNEPYPASVLIQNGVGAFWTIVAVLVAVNDHDLRLIAPGTVGVIQAAMGELTAPRLSKRAPLVWTLSKWLLLTPVLTSLAAFLLFAPRGGAGCLAVMSGWGIGGAVYRLGRLWRGPFL